MNEENNPLGNIYISHKAIASMVHHSALETYGVVGLAAKNIAEGLANAIVKDPALGVDIDYDQKSITINIYIIVEYGTRIKSVANSVENNIRFKIEKLLGLTVESVHVHVRGLRISNID